MIYVGIILVLLIAILAIPFEIIFDIHRRQAMQADIAVLWLFGVVRIPVTSKPTEPPEKRPSETPAKKPRKTKKRQKRKAKSVNFTAAKNLFWNARFRYRLIKFVKDIFKTIHIASFYLRIRLGLDDPADTGRLWAYMGPLAVSLSNLSNATINLEPEFQTETLDVDGSGRVRIVPLQVIFTVLAFVFSPVTINAFRQMRKTGNQ